MRPAARATALALLLACAPLLASAQSSVGAVGKANVRNPDPDTADSVVINTRNIPKPKPSTTNANARTQELVYANPGGGLTYGGGAMSSTRGQTAMGGVSNVNINKNKVWYANAAGRPYPAARARTALAGPLDFGGRRNINIRGNVKTSGGQNDNVNSMGPVTITQTYYARASAASGGWLYNSRRGRNTIAMTDPAYNVGGITNRGNLYANSAVAAMGSGRRNTNAVSGNTSGYGVQSRTRKASSLALAGGRR